mmetsp:Transcript_22490/g.52298  ORF Transcript_22490/g.52298 Transcript_22490/m.52298 type:complete len:222 (-) Transcript_22490:214-879(-)
MSPSRGFSFGPTTTPRAMKPELLSTSSTRTLQVCLPARASPCVHAMQVPPPVKTISRPSILTAPPSCSMPPQHAPKALQALSIQAGTTADSCAGARRIIKNAASLNASAEEYSSKMLLISVFPSCVALTSMCAAALSEAAVSAPTKRFTSSTHAFRSVGHCNTSATLKRRAACSGSMCGRSTPYIKSRAESNTSLHSSGRSKERSVPPLLVKSSWETAHAK